ncbi:MAG: ATP-binding cassette domain-containing protein, partial [Thermoproteota archaeon]
MLAIIGPNASGKTTLLKCINRILKPQKGSILINGEELEKMEKGDIAKKMGYVPQVGYESLPTTVFDT